MTGIGQKAVVYTATIAAGLVGLAYVVATVFRAGKTSATLDQVQTKLKDKALEAKVRADIDAVDAATRRKQLRQRWSKR
jgi:Na+/H+-dicarboxylate symporter